MDWNGLLTFRVKAAFHIFKSVIRDTQLAVSHFPHISYLENKV